MGWSDGFERRTLAVALAPERMTAVVREHGRICAWSEIRIDPDLREGHWRAALAVFRTWIGQAGCAMRGVPLTISISCRWCQLAMLPWSDALLDSDRAQRYQIERFTRIYGSAALDWEVFCDDAGRGQTQLACAIDREFAHGLFAAGHAAGHTHIRIESLVSATARSLSGAMSDRFAVIEPGWAVLAARRYGKIVGIEAQACTGTFPSAWRQWLIRAPEVGDVAQVVLFALEAAGGGKPAAPAPAGADSGRRVRRGARAALR